MIKDTTTPKESNPAKQEAGGGWMRRLVRCSSFEEEDQDTNERGSQHKGKPIVSGVSGKDIYAMLERGKTLREWRAYRLSLSITYLVGVTGYDVRYNGVIRVKRRNKSIQSGLLDFFLGGPEIFFSVFPLKDFLSLAPFDSLNCFRMGYRIDDVKHILRQCFASSLNGFMPDFGSHRPPDRMPKKSEEARGNETDGNRESDTRADRDARLNSEEGKDARQHRGTDIDEDLVSLSNPVFLDDMYVSIVHYFSSTNV